ncbi:hypothetical protein RSOLAG22IIIB_07134 [Rhizoctonia solani]|uniref:Uncharacterized protein n=1 Tax=Rhizoctonia solani TaxID=456999 RepID=A0A0K6GIU9_9AGAM|nr:hypothetical protein RSOLAG22IIIB_07134 [Rhizoctonia solani]
MRFSMTCKKFQCIVHRSTRLQLCIELDVNGLEIAKQPLKAGVTYATILEELKGYRDAWFNFKLGPPFRQVITDSIASQSYGQYHDEAYFEAFRAPEAGEYIAGHYPLNRIRISGFRSSTNSSLSVDFKRNFRNFFVDPKQDLVILIEYEGFSFTWVNIHLHHLSSVKPHSLARFPTLTVRFEELGKQPTFYYGNSWIMGYILVVRFIPTNRKKRRVCDNIVIWDWQSGLFLGQIISKPDGPKPTFIDKHHLLFFSYTSKSSSSDEPDSIPLYQPALFVYRIPTTTSAVAQESVTVDGYMPLYPPPLQPTLILELPKLNLKFQFFQLMLWDTLIHPGDLAYRKST